jgi:EpsI family protein
MVTVLFLARKLDDADAEADSSAARAASNPVVPMSVARSTLAAALLTALLLVLPQLIAVQTQGAAATVSDLPAQLGGWRISGGSTPAQWQPAFVNAQEQRARYEQGSELVDVYRASYPHQTRDARVVHTDNDFLGTGWRLAEQQSASISGSPVEQVSESRGYLKERERLIWSWYVVAGKPAATKLGAKLAEMRGFLQRRRDAAAVAISTDCLPDCGAARERLTRFMQQSAASLQ